MYAHPGHILQGFYRSYLILGINLPMVNHVELILPYLYDTVTDFIFYQCTGQEVAYRACISYQKIH